jgi:D-hexose-6-phosphate mutarotase
MKLLLFLLLSLNLAAAPAWYAILSEDLQSVIEVKQIESSTVDQLRAANNAKALRIRDAVEGTKPTPSSTQVLIQTGWDIGELTATRTWGLRDKTTEELNEDTRTSTRDQLIAGAIARIDTDLPRIQNAVTNFETLTTAQRWQAMKELLELVHFMARVQKAQLQNELQ